LPENAKAASIIRFNRAELHASKVVLGAEIEKRAVKSAKGVGNSLAGQIVATGAAEKAAEVCGADVGGG